MTLLIYKSRQEPSLLTVLKNLKSRFTLSKNDEQNYYNLKKGYEGELQFDVLLQAITCDCLVLNDLLLKVNNQTFQIDSLIILKNRIHLLEIKNYSGDFYFDSNRFFQKDRFEISNPLIQLQRTESLLRQLLTKYNFSIPVQSSVIFINPEFTLYQAPLNMPFIFPTQLNQFIKNLNLEQLELNEQHKNLAEKLKSLHISKHPLQPFPTYNYYHIQKGIKCLACESLSVRTTNHGLEVVCEHCGKKEVLESAILRTIREFQFLFPEEKITTTKMYEWLNIEISQKTIGRILKKNFKKIGTNRWIYYE
ncbi:nuclease-related domain-containing protein [Ureibacillus sp. GCM10028918]|uniref:nuclease-related domain-containing protein n=1 Tax=Ureibacillus sp. GCM10028918 TaxID=3273429 RepID=UPI0036241825